MSLRKEFVQNLTTRQLNNIQTDRVFHDWIKDIENHMIYLRCFAALNKIPDNPRMPPTIPMRLSETSIRNVPYRNYLIRQSIRQAENTLRECFLIPGKQIGGYFCAKLNQQLKAMQDLVDILKKPNRVESRCSYL